MTTQSRSRTRGPSRRERKARMRRSRRGRQTAASPAIPRPEVIFENVLDWGLSYSDERGIIRYCNRALCGMLGYDPREITDRRVEKLLDAAGRKIYARELRRRMNGKASSYKLRLRSKTGEMVPVQISAIPVFDEKGRFRGGYGVFTAINERLKVERLRDEILREASHALKAPVAKIRMGLDLLRKQRSVPPPPDEALAFDMIETEVERLRRNVDSFMELAAIESGASAIKKEQVDLVALLESLVSECAREAGRKGLSILFSPAPDSIMIRGDREKLQQLSRNIIANSIAFSSGGDITMSAHSKAGLAYVAVRDEGRGIEQELLEKIFEKHYKRFRAEPGMGIGLTLCRAIALMHGGRIWAESEGLGTGMTVMVELPGARSGRKQNAS